MLIIQMTGLSGAGKSTLAYRLQANLINIGLKAEVLDGDVYRKLLFKDLGFSDEDRKENIRRLGALCGLLLRNGVISIISAINPFEDVREEIRLKYQNVKTVWVNCSLAELHKRDTKDFYRRAALPLEHTDYFSGLTGVDAPYEQPDQFDLLIQTDQESIETSVENLFSFTLQNCDRISSTF